MRQPEGNGVGERCTHSRFSLRVRMKRFETIEELRLALLKFADCYNTPNTRSGQG